jgi:hypothetical protein
MNKILLIIILSLASLSTEAETITERLKKLPPEEWVYQALTVVDVAQTMRALDHPCGCYYEANPLYGKNPSDFQIVATTLAFNAAHAYLVLRMVETGQPEWLIKTVTYGSIAVRAGVVYHNFSIGIRF